MCDKIELNDGTQVEFQYDELNDYDTFFVVDGKTYYLDEFEAFSDVLINSHVAPFETERRIRKYKNEFGNVVARVESIFRASNVFLVEYYFSFEDHFTVLF